MLPIIKTTDFHYFWSKSQSIVLYVKIYQILQVPDVLFDARHGKIDLA